MSAKKKKIVFPVYGRTLPFFSVGADITKNNLAYILADKNYEVICLGHFAGNGLRNVRALSVCTAYLNKWKVKWTLENQTEIHYTYRGVNCIMSFKEDFYTLIDRVVTMNDIVFAINLESAKIVDEMNKKGAVTVAWVTDAVAERKALYKANPTFLLYNSRSIADFGLQFHNRDYHILNSPFLLPEKVLPPSQKKKVITLVNPIKEKGLQTFLDLSKRLPEYKFLAVESWKKVNLPDEYLTSNVICIPKQFDMTSVYNETRILLYPSHFNEGPGRAVIEAGLHGVPSVVSDKGSLPEAVGEGGVVVKSFALEEWVKAIYAVEKSYDDYSAKALVNAKRYLIDFESELTTIGII